MKNKFIKTKDYGYLLGEISDNSLHQHYAVQFVVALDDSIVVKLTTAKLHSTSQLITSMQSHQLNCLGQQVLILLINPVSKLGHLLNKYGHSETIQTSQKVWVKVMRKLAIKWRNDHISDSEFKIAMEKSAADFVNMNKACVCHSDKRIVKAMGLLSTNVPKIIPIETIASQVNLSPSRFIHLFKSETGITYRRMQLWNKLMASIHDISNHKNITDLAHAHGFSDSAHYSRTFKQTFGLNPKSLIKHSQFIQF